MEEYRLEDEAVVETGVQAEAEFPDVNTLEGRDEILRRAAKDARLRLRLTPGQLATLREAKRSEEEF